MFISSMRVSKGGSVTTYGKTTNAEASFCAGGTPSAEANAIWPSLDSVGTGVEVGRGVDVRVGGRVLDGVRLDVVVRVDDAVRVGGSGVRVDVPTRVGVPGTGVGTTGVGVRRGNGDRRHELSALLSARMIFDQSTMPDCANVAEGVAICSAVSSPTVITVALNARQPRIRRLPECG